MACLELQERDTIKLVFKLISVIADDLRGKFRNALRTRKRFQTEFLNSIFESIIGDSQLNQYDFINCRVFLHKIRVFNEVLTQFKDIFK